MVVLSLTAMPHIANHHCTLEQRQWNKMMTDVHFTTDTFNGIEIFRLNEGTKYLPSLYIQNNKNWNKWMVFEAYSNQSITNRTFQSREDCINFISTYDEQTESTLEALYDDINHPSIRHTIQQINFPNPKQVTPISASDKLLHTVKAQILRVAETYQVQVSKIKLICTFFDGILSLYASNTQNQNEMMFYIVKGNFISRYTPWKTLSIVMALIGKIKLIEEEYGKTQKRSVNQFPDNKFIADTLDGRQIFRLSSGTKYLPSLYIQNNENWNRWMLFESRSQQAITNRTFQTKEDCIEFINTYDNQSELTLNMLRDDIKDDELRQQVQQIDFSQPRQVTKIHSNNGFNHIIHAQQQTIASIYNLNIKDITLISAFFEGVLTLFASDVDDKEKLMFYVFNNGEVSHYASWKTVSVAMALFNKLIDYDKEKLRYKRLDRLLGKALIDREGHGFVFEKHIPDTDLVYVRKVRVTDDKIPDPNMPLTPIFIGELSLHSTYLSLEVRNHFKSLTNKQETYTFDLNGKYSIL